MLRVAGVEVGVSDEGMFVGRCRLPRRQPLPFFIRYAFPREQVLLLTFPRRRKLPLITQLDIQQKTQLFATGIIYSYFLPFYTYSKYGQNGRAPIRYRNRGFPIRYRNGRFPI
jgi:hypothetical protein